MEPTCPDPSPTGSTTTSLFVRRETLDLVRLDPADGWPAWAFAAPFVAMARTEDELSIVCPEGLAPPGVRAERGWRAIQVVGPLDFGLTGLLAGLLGPLARRGIAVFTVSTFDTDLILVRAGRLVEAVGAPREAGYPVRDPGS